MKKEILFELFNKFTQKFEYPNDVLLGYIEKNDEIVEYALQTLFYIDYDIGEEFEKFIKEEKRKERLKKMEIIFFIE